MIGSAYRTRIVNVVSYVDVSNPTGNAGGLAGYFGGQHNASQGLESKIINCAVYADITGSNAGGLIAEGWNGTQYYDITGCIYIGNVTGTNAGAIVGYQNTDSNTCTFTNVFWLEDDGIGFYGKRDTENQRYNNTEAKTLLQFASGEVAYLLGSDWGQIIEGDSKDALPVFANGQNAVYRVKDCDGVTDIYSNTNENKSHTAGEDDGNCLTEVACTVCGGVAVEARDSHAPAVDDGDCTTDITCSVCGTVTTEGANGHIAGEDDGDCTTPIQCTACDREAVAAKPHTAGEDDGDCTTDITCSVCGKVTTEGAETHTGGTATCTEKAKCTVCGTEYGEILTHSHGTEYKSDATNHWNECICGDKANEAAHTDSNNDGKCDVCEYAMPKASADSGEGNTDNDNNDENDGLGTGAIIGIATGSVAVVGLGGFALLWFVIKKKSFADLLKIFKK